MAVHNGSKFIEEQIASILPQLADNDEVVIVDDMSLDNTVAIIEGFNDNRIRITRQQSNCGVIQSFGRALKEARGEIVFLCDQDDVWRLDKVGKCLELFRLCPNVSMVVSDRAIIDASGKVESESSIKSKKFHSGVLCNLVRNHYQGSAMAFRRNILDYCLPFPADIPMHDSWIGIVNQLIGQTAFVAEPLLYYRRHESNNTLGTHAPVSMMIRWRWALVRNLVFLYIRRLIYKP
jgi:glycosyltransferase involved in cell wall biosynthesis